MSPLTIVTVLRSGGEYKLEHVERLYKQVKSHNPEAEFKVLSDIMPTPDNPPIGGFIPLLHKWPGWWSKIELFRSGVWGGSVVYLDLDSTVIGDLNRLRKSKFTMLSDFYRPDAVGSGVMAWENDPDTTPYVKFLEDPLSNINRYKHFPRWGDQGFISDHLINSPERFGAEVCSYKCHCLPNNGVPPAEAVVIAYHGRPKPWEVE